MFYTFLYDSYGYIPYSFGLGRCLYVIVEADSTVAAEDYMERQFQRRPAPYSWDSAVVDGYRWLSRDAESIHYPNVDGEHALIRQSSRLYQDNPAIAIHYANGIFIPAIQTDIDLAIINDSTPQERGNCAALAWLQADQCLRINVVPNLTSLEHVRALNHWHWTPTPLSNAMAYEYYRTRRLA